MKMFAIPALASALALAACGDAVDNSETAETAQVTSADATEAATDVGTIVDVAAGNEDFSTLVTAVTAADLAETLSGEGPFTVFAPTNAAFAKLPEGTLEELTKPESKATLVGILTYHVVAGETSAEALGEAIAAGEGTAELTTVNGSKLTASVDGEAVILTDAAGNTSTITATDIEASNGVVHVIDTVVMPG
ncbi:fasciclin domain-containing protein [Altererythrobacter sp. RZ02]|uniref:Fasciclin domain-containing protein n=1 Tax=Pontixanthobacter rizhaonensis TaxID=2730337 RepID=A0A848QSU7_9SPHN|nr:fasciclin domain-containing protein [Pontixanthobacter rizhaonensis]NMW32188.1 fasciclin domain-containing protein [Pontixanthobacter rizhaonensis]